MKKNHTSAASFYFLNIENSYKIENCYKIENRYKIKNHSVFKNVSSFFSTLVKSFGFKPNWPHH